MKKTTVSLFAGMTALVFTAGALSAQVVFEHNFESDPLGERPTVPPWDSSYTQSNYVTDSVQVVAGSVFSGSTQHLQVRDAAAFGFGKHIGVDSPIVLLSFDFVSRANTSAASRALNISFYGENLQAGDTYVGVPNRAHATGINTVASTAGGVSFGAHGQVVRFDLLMNNSLEDFSYSVGGNVYLIPSGQAGVWADGNHLLTHNTARSTGIDIGHNLKAIGFTIDNHATSRGSFDLDNVMVEAIPEPSTYALVFGGLALAGAYIIRRRRR